MKITTQFKIAMRILALVLGPAAALAGTETASDMGLPPFYRSVMQMKAEGKLGQVVKEERIATPVKGARAWRIAYVSSDLNDRKTLVTAVVVAPEGKAPKGGRPVISWSHGTTGTAPNCGPSQVEDPARPLNLYFRVGGDSWTDYGLPALTQFIAEGYVVVGTDYQGLGGPGRHQYAVARTNGRDAINAVRAVGSMKGTGAGRKAVAIGWSQGGGSTIAAAGETDYIARKGTAHDGVEFVGFVAMAPQDISALAPPPADEAAAQKQIEALSGSFAGNVFEFAHYAMNMWGIQAAFPDKLKLTDLFTEEGARALDEIYSRKCIHASSDTLSYTFGSTFEKLNRPKLQNALAWAQAYEAISVRNDVKPVAPVMVIYGNKDDTMPPIMGELYRKRMCAIAGANVSRMQLPGDEDHFSTPGASERFYLPWIADRFAARPAADGCAAE